MAISAAKPTGGISMPSPRIHTSEYPPVETPTTPIWQTVLAGAAERGDHPALIDGISGQTITYAQLAQMVERMAAGFAENGVKPGDVVALHSPNTVLYPVVFYAASRAGATVTTLSALTTAKDMANQLDDSKATMVITVGPLLPVAAGSGRRPAGLDLRPGRGPPQRAGADRVDRPGAERAGGRGPGRRRPPLLQRHHQPAQGRDAHPRQHRREPGRRSTRCTRWAPRTASSPSCRSSTSTA